MEVVLEYIKQSYGNPPVYILENGLFLSFSLSLVFFFFFWILLPIAYAKRIGKPMKQDLQLQKKDTPRIEFLDAYIGAVLKAVR